MFFNVFGGFDPETPVFPHRLPEAYFWWNVFSSRAVAFVSIDARVRATVRCHAGWFSCFFGFFSPAIQVQHARDGLSPAHAEALALRAGAVATAAAAAGDSGRGRRGRQLARALAQRALAEAAPLLGAGHDVVRRDRERLSRLSSLSSLSRLRGFGA